MAVYAVRGVFFAVPTETIGSRRPLSLVSPVFWTLFIYNKDIKYGGIEVKKKFPFLAVIVILVVALSVNAGAVFCGEEIKAGPDFVIHFFDVGEADSVLVECDGQYMLIDGGNAGSSSFLYSYLEKHDFSYLDCIVCTHAHADHVGGLAGALNYAQVGTAYAPVTEYDSRAFESFVKYLGRQGKSITIPSPGDSFLLGSASVTFLAPLTADESNTNNTSLVLRIVYGETSFLFAADAEVEEEADLLESGTELCSTLLKVAHHGSNTSSSQAFVDAVSPEYAVISVGEEKTTTVIRRAKFSTACPCVKRFSAPI